MTLIVGAGWLGAAAANRLGCRVVPRRSWDPEAVRPGDAVLVASGRSSLNASEEAAGVSDELDHLRSVLDACDRAGASRVVVLGSADVAGTAVEVRGASPREPETAYARMKAAVEEECVRRRQLGEPITVARVAAVHGPGKRRTETLVRISRWPVLPVPGGVAHSVSFVLLDDAIAAIVWLLEHDSPDIVSIGGGETPIGALLLNLGSAQGRRPRLVGIPLTTRGEGALMRRLPEPIRWALRLAWPRAVMMETPIPVTPLSSAARTLVAGCSSSD